jgi:lipid-binding SYLF domain-containing protein
MNLRVGIMCFAVAGLTFAAESKSDTVKRIDEAGRVFQEVNAAPDKGIPQEILEKAQCIGIVPGMKRAGFVIGGNYGKGMVVCRTAHASGWTAPAMIRIEGGSFGLQIGAGETDVVFVVMNQRGMDKLLESKFTVGGDAAAMAGPVGRSAAANTDAQMHAEILSYSRARGVFAGITLNGSTLRPDKDANAALYGQDETNREILTGKVQTPAAAQPLYTALNKYVPASKSARR